MQRFCGVFDFFFQAEDGIRDGRVTGVQTCALPIFTTLAPRRFNASTLKGWNVEALKRRGARVVTRSLRFKVSTIQRFNVSRLPRNAFEWYSPPDRQAPPTARWDCGSR